MTKRFRLHITVSIVAQKRIAWGLLTLFMLLYAVWISDQAVLRYDTFKATAFDLGNFDQAIWNTLHGRPFQFTNHGSNWYGYPIRLAQHVEPIIYLLSLLYTFHADPRILLIFQTLALTAGALPVFLLTRRYISLWPLLAPVVAAAYLLSPSLIGENIYDFHTGSLASPLLLFAILALTYRRYTWFVLACILTAACKEDMPFTVALLGLLVIWKYKLPRLGSILFISGTLWTLLAFLVIMPHFNVGAQHNNFWYRYSALGNSPVAAIINVLLHPWLLLGLFFTLDRIYYLFGLLRSVGFLPLLAPEWLLPALWPVAINLLSNESYQHSGVYHYNAAIIPFIMLAGIHGMRRLICLWYGWRGETLAMERVREANILQVAPRSRSIGQTADGAFMPRLTAHWQTGWQAFVARPRITRLRMFMHTRLDGRRETFHARSVALAKTTPVARLQWCCLLWIVAMVGLNYFIMIPQFNIFWSDHRPGIHEQRIQQLLDMIPPNAPVSANGNLNPHLTDRQYVTVFPQLGVATMTPGVYIPVDYVIVDLNNVSPEDKSCSPDFLRRLNDIQSSQQFRVLAQADGVILLVRNKPFAGPYDWPCPDKHP